jgi:ribosomal protein S18 acetylase RimI-like enzyme
MNVRPMTTDDITPLARLMASSPLWQRYNVTEASTARRLSDGLAQGMTIAVAEIEGEPVGFVWYVEHGAFNRSGYIMLIGVKPGMQGRGIGQALMEHAEKVLHASSQDVFLLVSDFNHAAQRFYARLGYQQVGAIPDYVIPGVTELVFHKHLRATPHET